MINSVFTWLILHLVSSFGRYQIESISWATRWSDKRHEKEFWRVHRNNERSHRSGCVGNLTLSQWLFLITLYRYRCAHCRRLVKRSMLTLDHVRPISKGGATTLLNVVPSCVDCNSARDEMIR